MGDVCLQILHSLTSIPALLAESMSPASVRIALFVFGFNFYTSIALAVVVKDTRKGKFPAESMSPAALRRVLFVFNFIYNTPLFRLFIKLFYKVTFLISKYI